MLISVVLFMTLANLKQFIYLKILRLKIVAVYKKCIPKKSMLKIESTTIILTIQSKQKKLETKNIFINEKNYKQPTINFTRYAHSKSIKIFSLYYHELIRKIKEHEGEKIFDG